MTCMQTGRKRWLNSSILALGSSRVYCLVGCPTSKTPCVRIGAVPWRSTSTRQHEREATALWRSSDSLKYVPTPSGERSRQRESDVVTSSVGRSVLSQRSVRRSEATRHTAGQSQPTAIRRPSVLLRTNTVIPDTQKYLQLLSLGGPTVKFFQPLIFCLSLTINPERNISNAMSTPMGLATNKLPHRRTAVKLPLSTS